MSPFEYPELSDPTDEDFAMNPTPSPAPRGELSASFVLASIKTELLKRSQDCGAIGDFIPLLEDKVESLTKHAAAISEKNQRLRGEIDQLVMERDHFHDERDTLRQWSEQAREVMQTALTIATEAPELNMANYDHDQVRHLNNAMIEIYQVLTAPQSHPAATNLTEEGK